MKEIKAISVKCETKDYLPLQELKVLQGALKSRTDIDYDKIKLSIIKYGFSFPLFIWKEGKNNWLIDGTGRHDTLCKMQKDGYFIPDLPVVYVDCKDRKEAKQKLLRLNSQYGKMTKESVLEFADDLEINFEEIALPDTVIDFSDEAETEEETSGDDEAPEVNEEQEAVSKYGEMYELGNSILMCGDSTKAEDVERLLLNKECEITFTSPPYNASCTPTEQKMCKSSKYQNVNEDNKTEEDYFNFLKKYIELSLEYTKYSFMNIQSLTNNKISLLKLLYEMKDYFCDVLIWDKKNGQPAMAENVLNSVFEFVYVFGGNATRSIGTKKFRGTIDNIVHIQKQTKNEFSKIHNATFPVEFADFFISNFTEKSCYEPFCGTGTTLISCEKHNKICYAMELSPKYCDVIRRRYTQWAKQNNRPITSGCLE